MRGESHAIYNQIIIRADFFIRKYTEALTRSLQEGNPVQLGTTGPDTRKERNRKFPPITAHARRLAITAKSTKLARFDQNMQKLGHKTLVKDMEGYRSRGHTASWLVEMTQRAGDATPKTRLEKLLFLAEGSPTLRYILAQIKASGLIRFDPTADHHPEKILITEEVPLIAWFWEIALNYLYIHSETLESKLSYKERVEMVKRFNDRESPLKVLILHYNVSAQGTNLDQSCHRVLVTTAALNASLEIQGWGRVIRASSSSQIDLQVRVLTVPFTGFTIRRRPDHTMQSA